MRERRISYYIMIQQWIFYWFVSSKKGHEKWSYLNINRYVYENNFSLKGDNVESHCFKLQAQAGEMREDDRKIIFI